MQEIIKFEHVDIEYELQNYSLKAVSDVTLGIPRGKVTAFVGESGSGKTTLVTSLLQCISKPGRVTNGKVLYIKEEGVIDILSLNKNQINHFRWEEISMVFQASQSTLNPLMTIYEQFYETAYYHGHIKSKEEFNKEIQDLLSLVKLSSDRVLNSYPHELSGGMKQRIMIVFALLLHPKVIILDEPTTALDVITQEYIFDQLEEINKKLGITLLLLTHDMGVVAKIADYVAVMYAGNIMECADVYTIFEERKHPYTQGLIEATPSILLPPHKIKPIPGNPPNMLDLPSGCPFHPRCKRCMSICKEEVPATIQLDENHQIRCHLFKKREATS